MSQSNGRAIFEALPRESTLASRVVREMESMIAEGGVGDGDRLPPERDLAAQFGVSRTVIREAVAALAARGLLEVQAGSGTLVRRPQVDAIARLISLSLIIGGSGEPPPEQLKESARLLAGEAASTAAERRTEEDLEILSRIVRESEAEPRRAESTVRFLQALGHAGQNKVSATLLEIVLELGAVAADPRHSQALRPILDQVRKADPKAARRAVRDLFDEPAPALPKVGSKKDRRV